jgi:hypothetical protein
MKLPQEKVAKYRVCEKFGWKKLGLRQQQSQCVCGVLPRLGLGLGRGSSFAVSVTASNFTMLQKIIEKYVYVPLERNCKLEPALSDDYDHAEMAQSWTEKKAGQSTLLCKGHEAAPHTVGPNIKNPPKTRFETFVKLTDHTSASNDLKIFKYEA